MSKRRAFAIGVLSGTLFALLAMLLALKHSNARLSWTTNLAAAPIVRRVDDTTIEITGEVKIGAELLFDGIAGLNDKTVRLNSGGGETEVALKIANRIRSLKLDTVVVGECSSACALVLFPAGRRKSVVQGGYLGLHWTAPLAFDPTVARKKFPLTTARISESWAMQGDLWRVMRPAESGMPATSLASQLSDFYRQEGIDPAIFSIAMAATLCHADIAITASTSVSALNPLAVNTTVSQAYKWGDKLPALWLPYPEDWQKAGLKNISSHWFPKTFEETQTLVNRGAVNTTHLIMGRMDELSELSNCPKPEPKAKASPSSPTGESIPKP